MKKIYLITTLISSALLPKAALAIDVINSNAVPAAVSGGPSVNQLISNIISILIYVVGIASVIVIIIGGIMYVVSAGNPDSVKKAKDAILYAVIGLVVAFSAFAIVNFVIGRL